MSEITKKFQDDFDYIVRNINEENAIELVIYMKIVNGYLKSVLKDKIKKTKQMKK